jgi:molybdenum cofactor cytidylyltransferase
LSASIAGVLLAAGQSSRMGPDHKLLVDFYGVPLVRATVANALASPLHPLIVVTGHRADDVAAALAGLPVLLVHNANYADGMAGSLLMGLAAVPETCTAAVVLLGDMPRIGATVITALIGATAGNSVESLCVPVNEGRRGNPVLIGRRWFPELSGLSGDTGARHLLKRHDGLVTEVAVADDAIFLDIDTPQALALARSRG